MKLSEDVVPLADLRDKPGSVVAKVTETHRPWC